MPTDMPLALTVLTALIAASAGLNIRAQYRGPRWQVYLFKPLTTTLILLLALTAPSAAPAGYRWLIVGGLVFSLAGDIFLMLPSDRFVAGLIAFLVAHLFYIAAFASLATSAPGWTAAAALVVYAAVFFALVLPHAAGLRVPVVVYGVVLAAMTYFALQAAAARGDAGGTLAAAGAVLFLVSDSVLAYDRFVRGFRAAQAVLLVAYFAAQWLISLSV